MKPKDSFLGQPLGLHDFHQSQSIFLSNIIPAVCHKTRRRLIREYFRGIGCLHRLPSSVATVYHSRGGER